MIESKLLASLGFITHGFATRQNGVSSGVYSSLNTSFFTKDLESNVIQNRAYIAENLNIPASNLNTVKQIHSNKVITIDNNLLVQEMKTKEFDGLITTKVGLAVAVNTADCIPLLFANTLGIVAAVHCGWKGLLNNIIAVTLNNMSKESVSKELGELNHKNTYVAVGPSIHVKSYEVGNDFYDNFINQDQSAKLFFVKENGILHFNMQAYAKQKLLNTDILEQHIDVLPYDSFACEDLFFSHRRSFKRNEHERGLQMSTILIKNSIK